MVNYGIFQRITGRSALFPSGEQVLIRPWGKNSLRVQATKNAAFSNEDWGLSLPVEECTPVIRYTEDGAELENGEIRVTVSNFGKLSFYHEDQLLLKEYYRTWEYGTEGWKDLDQITQIKQAARSIGSRAATTTASPSFLKRTRTKRFSAWASTSTAIWTRRAAGWS